MWISFQNYSLEKIGYLWKILHSFLTNQKKKKYYYIAYCRFCQSVYKNSQQCRIFSITLLLVKETHMPWLTWGSNKKKQPKIIVITITLIKKNKYTHACKCAQWVHEKFTSGYI